MGFVARSGLEKQIRQICEDWRAERPAEYAGWAAHCKTRREALLNDQGFSRERTMLAAYLMPSYVHFAVARFLGTQRWQQECPEAVEAFVSVLPCSKLNLTTGYRLDGNR
jgi:hypothetical protein